MVLADKLHLPRYAPDGQLMSYKFHHLPCVRARLTKPRALVY